MRGDDGGYREKNSFRDSAEAVNRKDQLSKLQQLRQPDGTRQMNAVLATFKAGIAPSRIAGQFGISQSDVRRVVVANDDLQNVSNLLLRWTRRHAVDEGIAVNAL